MDPLEAELRRVLSAPGDPHDVDAVLANLHAPTGGRPPRMLAALAVAAVVVVLVAVTALIVRPGDDRVVPTGPLPSVSPSAPPTTAPSTPADVAAEPWSGRTDYTVWTPPPDEVRKVATPCRSADLAVSNEPTTQRGDGTYGTYTEAVNTGTSRCTLDGYPGLTATEVGGDVIDLRPGRATFFLTEEVGFDYPVPATIDPGEPAVTFIRSRKCLAGETGYSQISVVLPGGAATPVDTDRGAMCGFTVEPWARFTPHVEAPERYTGLRYAIDLPTSVPVGGVLEYVVTIENVGDQAVDLRECPGYRQTIYAGINNTEVAAGTWRLSCDKHPVIAAGASRRYTIRLKLPTVLKQADEVLVRWGLVDANPDSGPQGFIDLVPADR